MDGETFYEEFKAALKYFDLPWDDKGAVTIWVEGQVLCMAIDDKKISINMPKEME